MIQLVVRVTVCVRFKPVHQEAYAPLLLYSCSRQALQHRAVELVFHRKRVSINNLQPQMGMCIYLQDAVAMDDVAGLSSKVHLPYVYS